MLLDSEISTLKKIGLYLGLGMGAVVVLTGPAKEETSALLSFLSSAKSISMSAFDNSTHKQVAVDRLADLAGLIAKQQVQPGTLKSNPQGYARVALMHFDGPVSRPIDHTSSPGTTDIAQHITADLQRLMTPTDQSKDMFEGPSDAASAALLSTVESALQGQAQGAVLLGYAIEFKNRQFAVHLVQANETISANDAKSAIEEKVPVPAKNDTNWRYGKFDQDSVGFTSSTYSAPVLESFSKLGYQGALAYKAIHQASSAFSEKSELKDKSPLPNEYLGYALPFDSAWSMAKKGGSLPHSFEIAAKAYSKDFGEYNEAWKHYEQGDFKRSIDNIVKAEPGVAEKSQWVANKAAWDVYTDYTSAASTDFRLSINEPCPANLSTLISDTQYSRAYEFSKSCSEKYGYAVSINWTEDFRRAMDKKTELGWPSLLGFESGVPVYSIVDERKAGFVKGSAVAVNEDDNEPYKFLFIGVNTEFSARQNIEAKQLLMTSQFILHHEVGHVVYNTETDLSDPADTLGLRSMDIEAQMDVYATQKLINQGYSKEDVLDMHRQFIESVLPNPKLLNNNLDEIEVAQAKDLVWHDGLAVEKHSALGEMNKTLFSNPLSMMSRWADKVFKEDSANIIEFNLRHDEVKRNLENFMPGDTTTLEQEKTLQERTKNISPS